MFISYKALQLLAICAIVKDITIITIKTVNLFFFVYIKKLFYFWLTYKNMLARINLLQELT